MTSPFLTYELLTPETADPVEVRITKSLNIELYLHPVRLRPNYRKIKKALCGYWDGTGLVVEIPLSDWPAVKQAIRELNEHYKEKAMKADKYGHELDEYEFDLRDWHCESWGLGTGITLTRKKPKVKVEWSNCSRFGDGLGENGIDFSRHGYCRYHIVQFRVTGYLWERNITFLASPCKIHLISNDAHPTEYYSFYGIEIRPDANGQWSAPVLLPESIFSRLDEICEALQDRANGGKG